MTDTDLARFEPWPKTPRLHKPMILTEKIDGTNAQVAIRTAENGVRLEPHEVFVTSGGEPFAVGAGSRKRWVTPDSDNFGFAAWVHANAADLVDLLGVGRHYGEWWGLGIQRGYGLDHKRFSLFNVKRWGEVPWSDLTDLPIDVVPILGEVEQPSALSAALEYLASSDSLAAARVGGSGPMEGVVVYHTASGHPYKVIFTADGEISILPKGVG